MFHDMGWGGMWFGWIFWIIIIVVLIIIVVKLMDRGRSTHISSTNETPLDILKKRYAKGEVTKEEFDRMKRELE